MYNVCFILVYLLFIIKKIIIMMMVKDIYWSLFVCSWIYFIKLKGVFGNDMNFIMMLGFY